MATLKETYSTTISQDRSSKDTCFAIPGVNLTAAYMDVDMDISILVYDDATCKIRIDSCLCYHPRIYGHSFACVMDCGPTKWTWKYKNHYPSPSKDDVVEVYSKTVTKTKNPGVFKWSFTNKSKDLGSIYNLNASEDGKDGYIYLGGISREYSTTDPIYPTPVKITIPGLGAAINKPTDYYPYAVYSGGWQSCNRDGGSFKKYSSSAWVDEKNTEDDTSNSTCFYYSGGWEIQPKIGSE